MQYKNIKCKILLICKLVSDLNNFVLDHVDRSTCQIEPTSYMLIRFKMLSCTNVIIVQYINFGLSGLNVLEKAI